MNELAYPRTDFMLIYNKCHRLAAAVFIVSNVMDQDEVLKTKIKKLSLDLVSLSVSLKDAEMNNAKRLISEIEKNSLELMSMLDIASVAGLVSKMNGNIIKDEFGVFLSELKKFSEGFEENKNTSVKSIFANPLPSIDSVVEKEARSADLKPAGNYKNEQKTIVTNGIKNGNGLKRKDLRKNMILDFVKGHKEVSIKDIVPNVTGCSEKTVQRELIALINEGKIKKVGERRWSRYSIV